MRILVFLTFLAVFAFGADVCNSADECLKLGDSYYDKKDYEKATLFAEKSCEFGNNLACAKAGYLARSLKDYKKSFKLYKKGCDSGIDDSCAMVAEQYLHGFGVAKDTKKAYEMSMPLCQNKKNAMACFNVGAYYFSQNFDFENGKKYTQMACKYNIKEACNVLKRFENIDQNSLEFYQNSLEVSKKYCKNRLKIACEFQQAAKEKASQKYLEKINNECKNKNKLVCEFAIELLGIQK